MRHSVRFGSMALGLALASLTAWATFGAAGCVVTTSDTTTDSGTTGDDTGTNPNDTGSGGTTGSILVQASSLLQAGATDGHATEFGKGSTYAEINAFKIAYAYAKIGASSPASAGTEFPAAGQSPMGVDASGNMVNGQIDGLPEGTYSIDVTGYLRGLNGPGLADGNTDVNERIPFMRTTCTATVTAGSVATASCTPLSVADSSGATYFKGIIFPADFIPDGWCEGAVASNTTTGFDLWRAFEPWGASGTSPNVSIAETDCHGVVFIDASKFSGDVNPTDHTTKWGTGIELKGSTAACNVVSACTITYDAAQSDLVWVDPSLHPECKMNSTTVSSGGCF